MKQTGDRAVALGGNSGAWRVAAGGNVVGRRFDFY